MSEAVHELLVERSQSGLTLAKARGKVFGAVSQLRYAVCKQSALQLLAVELGILTAYPFIFICPVLKKIQTQ
jgi:hypothetical protein